MDLVFVEAGKHTASSKRPACRARQSKAWCTKWAFHAAVNAPSAGKSLSVGMTGISVRYSDDLRRPVINELLCIQREAFSLLLIGFRLIALSYIVCVRYCFHNWIKSLCSVS